MKAIAGMMQNKENRSADEYAGALTSVNEACCKASAITCCPGNLLRI